MVMSVVIESTLWLTTDNIIISALLGIIALPILISVGHNYRGETGFKRNWLGIYFSNSHFTEYSLIGVACRLGEII